MAARVPEMAVSSLPETLALLAAGASFTGLTVIETKAAFELKLPSLTRNVKLSLP